MPYIHKLPVEHECSTPTEHVGKGSVWRCAKCDTVWVYTGDVDGLWAKREWPDDAFSVPAIAPKKRDWKGGIIAVSVGIAFGLAIGLPIITQLVR